MIIVYLCSIVSIARTNQQPIDVWGQILIALSRHSHAGVQLLATRSTDITFLWGGLACGITVSGRSSAALLFALIEPITNQ